MKKRVLKLFALTTCLLFLGLTLTAQSSNEDILAAVENTENYETIELAQMDKNLSTFMNMVALSEFGLTWKLADVEHTVLIPTNDAFNEMTIDKYLHLTNPKNKADLVRFVKYHFIPNKVMSYDLKDSQVIATESPDEKITVSVDSPFNSYYIGGSKIIKADVVASDGVIHIMNGVVEPNEEFLSMR